MQKEFRGVADPDQAWILGELIRYLEHRKSGALEFDDMGEAWVGVRDQVAAGTLRATDKGIAEVVARFDALLRFASLQLGRQLGTEVVPSCPARRLPTRPLRAQALTSFAVPDRRAVRGHPHPRHRRAPRRHRRPSRLEGHLPCRRRRAPRGTRHDSSELAGAAAEERAGRRAGGGRSSRTPADRQAAELLCDRAGEPGQPCPRPGQGAALVPGRDHRHPGHEARPRARLVHRLGADRGRRLLR